MKLLIISPTPTDPPTAGNRARVVKLVWALEHLGHDVTFAYAPYESADYGAMKARLGSRLRLLEAAPPPFQSASAKLRRKFERRLGLKSAHLWRVDEWFDKSLLNQVRVLQERECFEAVLIEYVFLSKLVLAFPRSVRTIIDTHDLMGNRHKLLIDSGIAPNWFATRPKEETRALDRADAIIAIQGEEADYLRRHVSCEVYCVGHLPGLDIAPLPDPGRARILFTGSTNPINIRGMEWFVGSIFPEIQRKVPNCELVIVGPIGHTRSWPTGTTILGNLTDLAPAYAQATVVINPVTFGTGLPVKTIEALSYGKPVVATPAGLRGLGTEFDGAVALAQDARAFADRVVELLESLEARNRLAKNAVVAARNWQLRQLASLQAAVTGRSISKRG